MNLVLIGMPGSGKSTVGKILSRMLCMPLADTDSMVEQAAGKTIPALFAQEGEAASARQAAALDNTVIATGGGIVLRPENMEALAATGMIFFRDRDLEDILGEDHMGRPLVGRDPEKLRILYTQRIELYRKYAQYIISNTKTAEEAAARIAALYREACQP